MKRDDAGTRTSAPVRWLLKRVHRRERGERHVWRLPPVLLQAVPSRLTLAALIYSATYLLNMTVPRLGVSRGLNREDAVAAAFILAGLLFAIAAHRRMLRPHRLMLLGLLFQLVGTVGIAYVSIHPPFPDPLTEVGFVGIPWTCVWIVIYPLLVPGPPLLNLVAGTLSALAVPATVWVHLQGLDSAMGAELSGLLVFLIVFPNLLCAGLGWLAASVMHGLAHEVEDARQMGSYRLEELLGQGGMGEVWRARHQMLARPAAVKLIAADRGRGRTDLVVRRFEQEAQATASLQSPHSIRLYDFGHTEDGRLYYVMELLEGIDLETLVHRHGPQPAGRVIHWLRQACHSLAEAHARGLVHRDVKPANLYACRQGLEVDFLKVLDFGLVKAIQGEDDDDTRMTAEHSTPGTPATMAPEVATGETEIDARADLYSLGCVAYVLLTGVGVFERDTPLQTLIAHVQDAPVPPSARTELEIPTDLESLVLYCLAKSPSDRPATAEALDTLLADCGDAGTWTRERSERWWETHLPALAESALSLDVGEG